jgi:hypothetical protein
MTNKNRRFPSGEGQLCVRAMDCNGSISAVPHGRDILRRFALVEQAHLDLTPVPTHRSLRIASRQLALITTARQAANER